MTPGVGAAENLHSSLIDSDEEPGAIDRRLFRQAQGGDFNAFERLVQRLEGRVYHAAYRILGRTQDAEDVVQQTFLNVIEHLEAFRGESAVATWILRIAANVALKTLRKRRGLPTVSIDRGEETYADVPHPDFIAEWREGPEALLERAELRELLDRAVAELDDKHRVVFVLRDIEGLSTEDAAEALGLTPSNVKVRLLRARLQLRERLTRAFGDAATRVTPDHRHEQAGRRADGGVHGAGSKTQ